MAKLKAAFTADLKDRVVQGKVRALVHEHEQAKTVSIITLLTPDGEDTMTGARGMKLDMDADADAEAEADVEADMVDTASTTAGAMDMLYEELDGPGAADVKVFERQVAVEQDADTVLSMMLDNHEDSQTQPQGQLLLPPVKPKRKKATAASKSKSNPPTAKSQSKTKFKTTATGVLSKSAEALAKKRVLNDPAVGIDEPPKKKQKKAVPRKSSIAAVKAVVSDVDRDLMQAIVESEDEEADKPWGLPTATVVTPATTKVGATDDADWDLEAALTVGTDEPVSKQPHRGINGWRYPSRPKEVEVDVELELLRAIGAGEDDLATPSPQKAPAAKLISPPPVVSNDAPHSRKRSREPTPPSPAQPVASSSTVEVSGTGRKRTKTARALANEELREEYDAIIPLPPTKKKKSTKGKGGGGDKDASYHFSKSHKPGGTGNGQPRAPKPAVAKMPKPQPQSRLQSVVGEGETPLGTEPVSIDEGSRPSARRSPTPPPRPKTPIIFVRPPRPRIPTEEDMPPSSTDGTMRESEPTVGDGRRRGNSPSSDPISLGLALDDEELFFLKAGLARRRGEEIIPAPMMPSEPQPPQAKTSQMRVHRTGSARSEGYYKIPEALKSAYLPQRNRAMVLDEPNAARANAEAAGLVGAAPAASASSRSNRVNTRRLVQGMEQANKAMGETQSTQLQFNQLRARKKQLIFARSPIHDWGLYAMEAIPQGEMVIEYVGEVIRAQVADKREKWYEKIGIGSSYLFRIDEDLVVDATKRGNLGRLINHSCTPNCNAKIIVVNSQKKIVIYAKSAIEPGEEITYDYHFPLEQEKIFGHASGVLGTYYAGSQSIAYIPTLHNIAQVCRRWLEIVKAAPELWTFIADEPLALAWSMMALARSRSHPFSLTLRATSLNESLYAAVIDQSHRWIRANIRVGSRAAKKLERLSAPILEHFELEFAAQGINDIPGGIILNLFRENPPRLRSLTLKQVVMRQWDSPIFSHRLRSLKLWHISHVGLNGESLLGIFRACQELEYLELDKVALAGEPLVSRHAVLQLPLLHDLSLKSPTSAVMDLVGMVETPRCTKLTISGGNASPYPHLLSAITRKVQSAFETSLDSSCSLAIRFDGYWIRMVPSSDQHLASEFDLRLGNVGSYDAVLDWIMEVHSARRSVLSPIPIDVHIDYPTVWVSPVTALDLSRLSSVRSLTITDSDTRIQPLIEQLEAPMDFLDGKWMWPDLVEVTLNNNVETLRLLLLRMVKKRQMASLLREWGQPKVTFVNGFDCRGNVVMATEDFKSAWFGRPENIARPPTR
ncbi:histone methyltransferase set1 [Tulasnella sp. 331]|nr:histone methyltransferase set1 [Tulasnella sp. 331]